MSSVQGESPLVQVKDPYGNSIWLLVGCHPATRSVLSTLDDSTRKRVWQYIEKERKLLTQDLMMTLLEKLNRLSSIEMLLLFREVIIIKKCTWLSLTLL